MTVDLFKEFIPDLTYKKEYILTEDNEKDYAPYIANMALSHYMDCILYVNQMNQYPFLDKKMQYDYLFYSIRKNKRYTKWIKKKKSDLLNAIKEYYSVSETKAKEIYEILTPTQQEAIMERINKGGTTK